MTTTKKATEKISLPLIFVTFVVVLLMFAVSPVSAAPGCVDADEDGYYKFHRKHCPEGDDLDDDCYDVLNTGTACHVDTTSTVYTAKLIDGAFIFADELGTPISDPIDVITGSDQGIGLVPLADDVEMRRPTNLEDQATWDRMFYIGCPNLGTTIGVGGFKILKIKSTYNDWSIEEPGNYRLILRDIRLTIPSGVEWDVTMQLIGAEDYDPYPAGWLPTVGDYTHIFHLTRGRMWGREIRGGPGGRMSCYSNGSDIGEFDLGDDSILEIKIP